ncbi:MAG TPA: ABC transporter permease, partial [Terriglobales bacterium]|nr:ABC transporter permease [Terriglobales bacterium]
MATLATSGPPDALRLPSRARSLAQALRSNPLAAAGVVLIALFIIFALFGPWIAPQDPARIDLPLRLTPPNWSHWFGTDELGRDILSRVIYGARISMLVGSSVVALSLLLGLIIGCLAGYYGGRVDRFINIILMNAFLSFPGLLLAIAFVAFLGPGILNLILALSIGGWVGYARLVRAQVLATREREFVEAARALGANDLRILLRHILPNMIQPVIVQAAIGMAGSILAEAT